MAEPSGSAPTDIDVSAPLEVVLCTEELIRRPLRQPDYRKENRALVTLSQALADSPRTILQTLTDIMLDVLGAGSTGVSLLTKDGGKRFYWPAISGEWKNYIGGGTPRDFGPCGDVLDRNSALLFHNLELRYPYFKPAVPRVEEALLVPFYVEGKAVGTIWAASHTEDKKFDVEDERLMKSLGLFASSAYQILEFLDALKWQGDELAKSGRSAGVLAAIVESSDDAIVSKDLDGIITSWNAGAERIFGYKAAEAVGQSINLIIPADRLDEEKRIIATIRRGERVDHFETVRQKKDGSLIDISVTISPVRDAMGSVIGASKVARDITDRQRSEKSLAEQARLVDLSTDAIIIRDLSGRIRYWNKGAFETYGFSREEAAGQLSHELLHTQFPESLESITKQLEHDGSWFGELKHRRKDGRPIVVSSRWVLDQDASNVAQTVLETNNDITLEKLSETALRFSQEQLRSLTETLELKVQQRTAELDTRNHEISDLSMRLLRTQDDERRHIARELHDTAGQTMTVVGMKLDQLIQDLNDSPMTGTAETIRALIQQLNQSIRTTSYLLHPPLLDEAGLSAALAWYVQGLAERGLDIKLDVPENAERLPDYFELVMFRLVQECLTNVHRHAGSKTAVIQIVQDDRSVTVTIQDQGTGISSDKLAEIGKGGGVGIRGMRERVKQLNGSMDIESGDWGTKITFRLPVGETSFEERLQQAANV